MIWTRTIAKKFLRSISNSLSPDVKSATEFILSELDKMEKYLSENHHVIKTFSENDENMRNAKKFLSTLSELPTKYSENEKSFIDELNANIETLRKNSTVWYDEHDLPHEIWRDVKNYEGLYQVSNYGRIKSLYDNRIKILKPSVQDGYLATHLSKKNIRTHFMIHRLVADAFFSNIDNKPYINHKDGVKYNNCVWNLEWVTQSENIRHAYATGLIKSGAEHYQSKLTPEQVKFIRQVYKPYDDTFGIRALARFFNVTKSVIQRIVHNEGYKNVK